VTQKFGVLYLVWSIALVKQVIIDIINTRWLWGIVVIYQLKHSVIHKVTHDMDVS